ncbi:hypothetical protein ERJ75_001228900 [Trypanosoma vivax]|uniref:Uncharacterized protein n=1 Tax=Trypanosoma vivax (strain Y486) TaxID=1055687 RepID=G0U1D6_TRYVY|nr:hypothetical protein ERJ75_001228900 [Trypanosoma vivax]CCC49891.1 conserved hypothetical protein [Trypanosoma vivax Y486]
MAIVFPNDRERDALIEFASSISGYTPEDLGLLNAACISLIEDYNAISEFVLQPRPGSSETRLPLLGVDSNYFPIEYRYMLQRDTSYNYSVGGNGVSELSTVETEFRPHESVLRNLQQRLSNGKATLLTLNQRYEHLPKFTAVGHEKNSLNVKNKSSQCGGGLDRESAKNVFKNQGTACENSTSLESKRVGSVTKRDVNAVYAKFLLAFDTLIPWVSSILNILDKKDTAPSMWDCDASGENVEESSEKVISDDNTARRSVKVELPDEKCGTVEAPEPKQESTNVSLDPSSVHSHLPTPSRMKRVIRVTRYQVHDVRSIFLTYHDKLSLFYDHDYTFLDPRLHRRLLLPAYLHDLKETLSSLNSEIGRLEQLALAHKSCKPGDVKIVFHPSIHDFLYIRDSAYLYWCICVNEDDITALQFYSMRYSRCVSEAAEVVAMLKQLRRPTSGDSTSPDNWILSSDERSAIETGFEVYWRLRKHVIELSDSLSRDIRNKNRTHRYKAMIQSQDPHHNNKTKEKGALGWALSEIFSWTSRFSCSAEIPEGESFSNAVDEVFLTTVSPLYEPKVELLRQVQQMAAAVETQGKMLETDYPNLFYRDSTTMWIKRANVLLRHLESVSVVFSKPVSG